MFSVWGTAIYAEDPNGKLYGAILVDSEFNGPRWDLDCAGFSYYPKDQPYVWDDTWTQVDPLAIHRHLWIMLQSLPYGDFGVEVDVVRLPGADRYPGDHAGVGAGAARRLRLGVRAGAPRACG